MPYDFFVIPRYMTILLYRVGYMTILLYRGINNLDVYIYLALQGALHY